MQTTILKQFVKIKWLII